MTARAEQRQQQQLAFQASNQNIEVGLASACPLAVAELAKIDEHSPHVREVFDGGLTAKVYHLEVDGSHYCLKQQRRPALVKNADGATSFLNEVQRRQDLQALKQRPATSAAFKHIVPTLYANYREGIILSPWIEGTILDRFSREIFNQLFSTLFALEQAGLMEWDLSPGNILYDGHNIHLFDFGYMYRFDPLAEYNSDGLTLPEFHAAERFETRNLFGFLLRYQDSMTESDRLALFRELKEAALDSYTQKRIWLRQNYAKTQIIDWVTTIIARWEKALDCDTALACLYRAESFRSHCLDIADDLSGKSCTPTTLLRIDAVIETLATHYLELKARDALLFDNKDLGQHDLIHKYQACRKQAEKYLLSN